MFNPKMDLTPFKNLDGPYETLLIVGKEASKNGKWKEYSNYCFKREEGLKKEAFFHLDIFIKSLEKFSFNEKIEFVTFLFENFERTPGVEIYSIPHPLREKVKTILEEWCENEKEDSNPFRWYGKFIDNTDNPKSFLKALEINPTDDKSRSALIDQCLYRLWFSCHHLPEGYIGDSNEDLSLIEKINKLIKGFSIEMLKITYEKKLDEYREIINNYQLWQKSDDANLKEWSIKYKKRVSLDIETLYIDK